VTDHPARPLRTGWRRCLLLAAILAPAAVAAADPTRYLTFDTQDLRAAEARLSELVEPGSDRVLREPLTEIERYVVERQLRLHAEFTRRAVETRHADGSIVTEHPATTTTGMRVYTGEHGQPLLECAYVARAVLDIAAKRDWNRESGQQAK
jgi:hypothetical protein